MLRRDFLKRLAVTAAGLYVAPEILEPRRLIIPVGIDLNTTRNGPAAATDFRAGDWVKLGSGDIVEYHRVAAFDAARDVLTLETPIVHGVASGTVVLPRRKVTAPVWTGRARRA